MKKTYIAPIATVVKIETASMLAFSAQLSSEKIESSDGFGARDYDFDDDEE